jgi:hypothetical protein
MERFEKAARILTCSTSPRVTFAVALADVMNDR